MRQIGEDATEAHSSAPKNAAAALAAAAALFALGVVQIGVLAAPAGAQQTPDDTKAEQQRLAAVIAQHPTDFDSTFRYVRLSEDLHDNEAAIGALERMVLYNPGLYRAQFELGVLYFQLGSYTTASQYFNLALANPDLDADTKARIAAYLPQADKAQQQSQWTGQFQTGLRYQSNASFFPNAGLVRLFGSNLILPTPAKSDWNAFALAQLGNDYDLQNQRGDRLETRFTGYATQQFRLSQYDLDLVEASFGPRLAIDPDAWSGATFKPYVVGSAAALGSADYLNSGGAGLTLHLPFGTMVAVEPDFEWRQVDVRSTSTLPAVDTLSSGHLVTGSLALIVKPTQRLSLETRATYEHVAGQSPGQTFNQWGGEALINIDFDPPVAGTGQMWTVSPFAKLSESRFAGPDPTIDPVITRHDTLWQTGLMLQAPITPTFGFNSMVQYTQNASNVPNYRVKDWSVMGGPTLRF